MKIVSPFTDYYDGVARVSFDKDTLYIRKPDEQDAQSFRYSNGKYVEALRNVRHGLDLLGNACSDAHKRYYVKGVYTSISFSFRVHYISFCDKVYIIAEIEHSFPGSPGNDLYIKEKHFAYSKDELDNLLTKLGIKIPQRLMFYRDVDVFDVKLASLNQEHNSPIVVLTATSCSVQLSLNVSLKALGFPHIMDANTAFQEIFMWMNSKYTRAENNVAQVEDNVRVQQHGFDKHSFRNLPTKRKGG